jgi:cytochrome oxidase Cu insertion factor (SCO1/SenC/PrrC family)
MTAQQHDYSHWVGNNRLNRRAIPNISVTDHHGQKYHFYDDLARRKIILLSFTSIAHNLEFPVTKTVAEVCQILDKKNDQHTLVYTITVDPMHDNPRLLKNFADLYPSSKRWRFLTGLEADLELLRSAFFVERGVPTLGAGQQLSRRADVLCLSPDRAVADCSMGLLRYGNEAIDLWAGAPASLPAKDIATRLSWICESNCRPANCRRRDRNIPVRT